MLEIELTSISSYHILCEILNLLNLRLFNKYYLINIYYKKIIRKLNE